VSHLFAGVMGDLARVEHRQKLRRIQLYKKYSWPYGALPSMNKQAISAKSSDIGMQARHYTEQPGMGLG
jgi:hypothetical protein